MHPETLLGVFPEPTLEDRVEARELTVRSASSYSRGIASSMSMMGMSSLISYFKQQALHIRPSLFSVRSRSPLHFGHTKISNNFSFTAMVYPLGPIPDPISLVTDHQESTGCPVFSTTLYKRSFSAMTFYIPRISLAQPQMAIARNITYLEHRCAGNLDRVSAALLRPNRERSASGPALQRLHPQLPLRNLSQSDPNLWKNAVPRRKDSLPGWL